MIMVILYPAEQEFCQHLNTRHLKSLTAFLSSEEPLTNYTEFCSKDKTFFQDKGLACVLEISN